LLFYSDFNENWNLSVNFSKPENLFSGFKIVTYEEVNGQTGIVKLIGAFL
jgi:hypothetical protein